MVQKCQEPLFSLCRTLALVGSSFHFAKVLRIGASQKAPQVSLSSHELLHCTLYKQPLFFINVAALTIMARPTLAALSAISQLAHPGSAAFLNSALMLRHASFSSIYSSPILSIPTISLNIPDILSDIWEGVLRAVPKKKTSHMKRRHRQLAGKALKDVKNLNSCPACGEPKRAHHLCPSCVEGITIGF